MKRSQLLHAELSGLIASFGHGDLLVIGDAGLPVPAGVRCIDLALTRGTPSIFEVLDTILTELVVERSTLAQEAAADLRERFQARQIGDVQLVTHQEFKEQSRAARAIVRTGECTPYANIALYAGVAF